MTLHATVIPVPEVAEEQTLRMLSLMQAHYENVSEDRFRVDLARKDWVILLEDKSGIQGFSTQSISELEAGGQAVRLLFSGDTIIDQEHWGSPALPIAWGRFMLSLLAQCPERPLYWILTSKGYKTYRFLPVFFKEYYPHPGQNAPDLERSLIIQFCRSMFGARFDEHSWIIRAESMGQRLRTGIADVTPARRRNHDVLFFEHRNPGHHRGDELACIAPFHPENLTPFILKWLSAP